MDILDSYRTRFVPKEMAFSDAEYRARLSRVRDAMGAHGLDLLLLHHLPSVCYLTGYQTPVSDWYTCLVVPREGDLALQVCDFEVGLALVHTSVERILSVRWNRMDEAASQLVELLRGAALDGKRVGDRVTADGPDAPRLPAPPGPVSAGASRRCVRSRPASPAPPSPRRSSSASGRPDACR